MKYREEFEKFYLQGRPTGGGCLGVKDGAYTTYFVRDWYGFFAAGYEAAQRKSVEIWAEKNGYEVLNNEPTA